MTTITRRQWLVSAAAAGVAACLPRSALAATTTTPAQRYRIAAADWMMLKRQKPGALQLAHECGLDGVQVDMGPLGTRPDFENNLVNDDFRMSYLDTARTLGLEISSLAMSAFYGQSFVKHPKAEQFARAMIDSLPKLSTKTGFIPLMTRADLKTDDPEADAPVQRQLVDLFRRIAPVAEKAGATIGISTQLDGDGNARFLDQIGSSAVRIAYNIGEAIDAGRDVYKELRTLGRERIAEIVPTLSDGLPLEQDKRLDVLKLKAVLDEIDWSGWLVLQRSRDANRARDVKYNFSANARYLKSIFQT